MTPCRINQTEIEERHRKFHTFKEFPQKAKIAWLVSHCHTTSDREGYVKKLHNYMEVEIYGKCGITCTTDNCLDFVSENHLFLISFENSMCRDYVTEKLFSTMKKNIIPIVLGKNKEGRLGGGAQSCFVGKH